jgi:hypothetical protein
MNIQKLTLSQVTRQTTDKNGNPLKTKDGKPYTRVLIKAVQHGDKFLSGFGGEWNKNWQEGDEVSVEVSQIDKDGKTYYNFSRVNIESQLLARVEAIEKAMKDVISEIKILKSNGLTSAGTKVPDFSEVDEEINPDDIPL